MLVFHTISQLKKTVSLQELIDISIEWIDKSNNYNLKGKLGDCYGKNEFHKTEDSESFKCFVCNRDEAEYACILFETNNEEERWKTELVYKKCKSKEIIFSISLYVENAKYTKKDPKKPYICKLIDEKIGFMYSEPYKLKHTDVELATRIVKGEFETYGPCVYVSMTNYGELLINIEKLSKHLSGMARIFIEPNIYFAHDLRIKSDNSNPYNGAVGIFFYGSEHKRILLPKDDNMTDYVFNEVRNALNLGYAPDDLSYNKLLSYMYEIELDKIRGEKGENEEWHELADSYEKKYRVLCDQLNRSKSDNEWLRERVKELEKKFDDCDLNGGLLSRGDAIDSYEGQVYNTIIEALEKSKSSFPDGTRKKYIISDLLKVNLKKEKQEIIEDRIKNILKDYSSMTGAIESGLKAIGIEVNKDGKHHKIYFKDCPEITHTLPSSGSDQRGWKNNFSELKKKLL